MFEHQRNGENGVSPVEHGSDVRAPFETRDSRAPSKAHSGSVMSHKQGDVRESDHSLPLEELSWTITKNASLVSQYLRTQGFPQPSSHRDGLVAFPGSAPQPIQEARQELIAASLELFNLAVGPSEFLPNLATGFQYISCLSWLCRYNIFHLVPLDRPIGYEELAIAAGVPERRLRSIVRMAMTSGLFHEQPDARLVEHSATSALLAREKDVYAYATYMCNKSAPMAMEMTMAHQKWGADTMKTNETAYNVAFATNLPFFDHLAQDETRMSDFAAYMKNVRSSEGVALKHLVAGFAWEHIRNNGTVVDVGGSTGSAASALAKAFPHLSFVVQDLPANADRGRNTAAETLAPDIAARLTFQGHDFMKPQPIHGAEIYLLRMILHDWPDHEAVIILRNIVAAMVPRKSRLLIMDTALPKPGSVPVSIERIARARDLTMMQAFNSSERDLDDWRDLLIATDTNLELVGVVHPSGSAMSVLEVALKPSAS